MKFISVREFSHSPSRYINLSSTGDDVVITKNGRPVALLSEFSEDDVEDFILAKHLDLEKEFSDTLQELKDDNTVTLDSLLQNS